MSEYIGTEVADQFRIEKRIGTGGMGAVYRASQPDMNRNVAVKILHKKYLSRHDLVSRFRREARAMSHLSHPNTARVFMYGQLDDGACYFVMEYLEGQNLAQLVRSEGKQTAERVAPIMAQVCGALSEAHRAGIIHRDLKPENIFLTSQGGIEDFPKVLDFGLAKVTEKQMRPGSLILTREGMVFGTPEFMSPEQARGETLDGRSDIYSLGVITYELLSGELPFTATAPVDYIKKHATGTPKPLAEWLPDLNPAVEAAVMRSLSKQPEDRYQTADEFGKALTDALMPKTELNTSSPSGAPDSPSTSQAPKAADASQEQAAQIANVLSAQSKDLDSSPVPEGSTPEERRHLSRASIATLAIAVILVLIGIYLALRS